MGRKLDISKRDEIARRAVALLKERGPHRLSMSELARALEMKRSTLYWYFDNMEAIFEWALRSVLEQLAHFSADRVMGAEHPIDALYQFALSVDDYFREREDTLVFLIQLWGASGGAGPELAVEISREYFQPRRRMAITLVESGIKEGLVAPCDPAALVHFISAFIDGLLVQRIAEPGPLPALHDFLWTHVLEPLKRPASSTTGQTQPQGFQR